jgi:hypothetical protein
VGVAASPAYHRQLAAASTQAYSGVRTCYNYRMRFIRWQRGDVLGALFVLAVLGLLLFTYIQFPGFKGATGFGPDWDCMSVPNGEPICAKKVAR